MKKALETLCGLCCLASLVFAGGEMMDGPCSLPWTLGWMVSAAFFGWAFGRLTDKEGRANV